MVLNIKFFAERGVSLITGRSRLLTFAKRFPLHFRILSTSFTFYVVKSLTALPITVLVNYKGDSNDHYHYQY